MSEFATRSLRPGPQATFRPLDEGGVILNVETGAYYQVNASGRFLWEEIEPGIGRGELVERLVSAFSVDDATAGADVDDFIHELDERQLLDPADG